MRARRCWSTCVGLSIPDSDLTARFDAKLRKTSLEDLLGAFLRARASEAPIVLVLEDCHWIDELSRDLLEVLGRAAAALPVLFVLAYRPAAEPGGGLGVERQPRLRGARPRPHGSATDAASSSRSSWSSSLGDGRGGVRTSSWSSWPTRSDGNPFYIEELLSFIAAQGVDTTDSAAIARHRSPREPPHASS